ncbi:MAG: hypothetical protein ACI8W8_004319 [Rhodothermales bacterium]|jgi:hypothetical protein
MPVLPNNIILAQASQDGSGGGLVAMLAGVFTLAIFLVTIIGFWKAFEKAGKPGWGAIIPIYNIVLLLEIGGRPLWWIVLFFIPFVNAIAAIIVSIDIAKKFDKGAGFGVGMALFPFPFYALLGFGDAEYQGG